jgi:sortase (surface protein transpeptidase)
VDAPIVDVGLTSDKQLESPREAHQVGWYAAGARPGEPGNALFDGHLDWYRAAGVFWALGKLEPGDEIVTQAANGEQVRFVVEWKELYEVDKAPLERIFGPTSGPTVTLITCGGQFDRTSKSYTHRWVVRAIASPGLSPTR